MYENEFLNLYFQLHLLSHHPTWKIRWPAWGKGEPLLNTTHPRLNIRVSQASSFWFVSATGCGCTPVWYLSVSFNSLPSVHLLWFRRHRPSELQPAFLFSSPTTSTLVHNNINFCVHHWNRLTSFHTSSSSPIRFILCHLGTLKPPISWLYINL